MPRKKWKVATAAFAVVKGKKVANTKRDKTRTKEKAKQNSSFLYSSSGKSHPRSHDTDSNSSLISDGLKVTASSEEGDHMDDSDTSGSSSSNGCGTYHRRESLSHSSSLSPNSDESSFSSHSDSGSSRLSESHSSAESLLSNSEDFHSSSVPVSVERQKSKDCKSNIGREILQTVAKSLSSKKLVKSDTEIDEESESSSKLSLKSNKSNNPTLLNPSMYDVEQASMMQRRRSSLGGRRSRGSKREGQTQGGSAREPKNDGLVLSAAFGRPTPASAGRVIAGGVMPTKITHDGDLSSQDQKRDDLEENFHALLQKVRSLSSLERSAGKPTRLDSTESEAVSGITAKPRTGKETASSAVIESCGVSGEMPYSVKTELLANANSNLLSSVISDASEESMDSQNYDDASKEKVGSSRFASMMADLKSSNESSSVLASNSPNKNRVTGDIDSDEELVFEAPRIVYEGGQSIRNLLNDEILITRAHSDNSTGGIKAEEDCVGEGSNSRFRVHKTSRDAQEEQYIPAGDFGESNSDDIKDSDASISTASSSEDQYSSSATNLARVKYSEEEENFHDYEMGYYGEPAMTILTPITEMGSMESDVETASNGSNTNASDDDFTINSCQAGPPDLTLVNAKDPQPNGRSRSGKHKNIVLLSHVISLVKANNPDVQHLKLDDSGLVDYDAAKLFYLLRKTTCVTDLSLANNRLGDSSAMSLAQLLTESMTIKFVRISGNNIGNKGALALKDVLNSNGTLACLDMSDNVIDSYVMEGLWKCSTVFLPSSPCLSSNQGGQNISPVDHAHRAYLVLATKTYPSESGPLFFSDAYSEVYSLLYEPQFCDSVSTNEYPIQSVKIQLSWRGDYRLNLRGLVEDHGLAGTAAAPPSKRVTLSTLDHIGNETLPSCGTLDVYDKAKDSFALDIQTNSHHMFSPLRQANNEAGDKFVFLLTTTLALSGLDSIWLLKSTPGSVDGKPSPTQYTLLGDSQQLLPWKMCFDIEKYHPDENGTCIPVARQSLHEMSSMNWRDAIATVSTIRNRLLSLSQVIVQEPTTFNTSSSIVPRPLNHSTFTRPNLHQWASSFKKLDPRWQIRKFFNDMSVFGTVLSDVTQSDHLSEGAAMFSVWRPTSLNAIAHMMRGDGVGKGLEIKGKSAKKGDLSGYIPFLQIHQEEHKHQIRTIPKGDRTKIFFKSIIFRDRVGEYLGTIAKELTVSVAQAKFALARAKFGCDPHVILREELNYASKALSHELENPTVIRNDEYAPEMYCIEVSCRVLWEGLVERKDISRLSDSNYDTGRASQPAFQDMNFAALRQQNPHEPCPVLFQNSEDDPFDARMLVMAYEEEGKVVPVVSDFDCFLIGSRNFSYEDPMSTDQVELLAWCVSQIEWILHNHTAPESWTTRWLEVLKIAAQNGFYPSMPRFGFGDPTSYSMIEASVQRSAKTCGAVRHGPECFNFFFPQELDDEFLIIFPGTQLWKYVNQKELLGILRQKIREGFTFPLNPKWLLCDAGWISLFQDLLHSHHSSVQDSIDLWFPPDSGLRERILNINRRFPDGFHSDDQARVNPSLAEEEYGRYLILQRARKKLRGYVYWRSLLLDIQERATSIVDDNFRGTIEEMTFLSQKRKRRLSTKTGNIEDETIREIRELDFFSQLDESGPDDPIGLL